MATGKLLIVLIACIMGDIIPIERSKNCNYVSDLFLFDPDVNPPSQTPTINPTRNPTNTPTMQPTFSNGQTRGPTSKNEQIIVIDNSVQRSFGFSSWFLFTFVLGPARPNDCLLFPLMNVEPWNNVSLTYTCINSTAVQRTIYWDSLDCSGNNMEVKILTEANNKDGLYNFNCEANAVCPLASLEIKSALTPVILYYILDRLESVSICI